MVNNTLAGLENAPYHHARGEEIKSPESKNKLGNIEYYATSESPHIGRTGSASARSVNKGLVPSAPESRYFGGGLL